MFQKCFEIWQYFMAVMAPRRVVLLTHRLCAFAVMPSTIGQDHHLHVYLTLHVISFCIDGVLFIFLPKCHVILF